MSKLKRARQFIGKEFIFPNEEFFIGPVLIKDVLLLEKNQHVYKIDGQIIIKQSIPVTPATFVYCEDSEDIFKIIGFEKSFNKINIGMSHERGIYFLFTYESNSDIEQLAIRKVPARIRKNRQATKNT